MRFTELLTENNTTDIIVSAIGMVVAVCLILFLSFRVSRERKKIREERLQKDRISFERFVEFIDKKCTQKHFKNSFSIFKICINNATALIETYGSEHYEECQAIINERLKNVFQEQLKLCGVGTDIIYIMSDAVSEIRRVKEFGHYICYEISKPISLGAGIMVHCDVSTGITMFCENCNTRQALLQNVDLALIKAKKEGLNSYAISSVKLLDIENDDSLKIYNDVQSAIKNNEFSYYAQPICAVTDKKTVAYEMLLRWDHGALGVISPAQFLNILEQSGNMGWIRRLGTQFAAMNYKDFVKNGNTPIITQNLSKSQLIDPALFEETLQIVKKYQLKPQYMGFEISDVEVLEYSELASSNVKKLADAGFIIALDNFSLKTDVLSIAESFKIDLIKIKKDLIFGANGNNLNSGILKVLIEYAETNGIKIVAMGVETEEELEKLRISGIKYVQGYLLGKPVPVSQI